MFTVNEIAITIRLPRTKCQVLKKSRKVRDNRTYPNLTDNQTQSNQTKDRTEKNSQSKSAVAIRVWSPCSILSNGQKNVRYILKIIRMVEKN